MHSKVQSTFDCSQFEKIILRGSARLSFASCYTPRHNIPRKINPEIIGWFILYNSDTFIKTKQGRQKKTLCHLFCPRQIFLTVGIIIKPNLLQMKEKVPCCCHLVPRTEKFNKMIMLFPQGWNSTSLSLSTLEVFWSNMLFLFFFTSWFSLLVLSL